MELTKLEKKIEKRLTKLQAATEAEKAAAEKAKAESEAAEKAKLESEAAAKAAEPHGK